MNTLQLQFLIAVLAGWVNRSQQDSIEYLQEENRLLREQLGARRLLFTDVQRRRLAAMAKKVGRKGLLEINPLVTPDTLLRWYRKMIARKYDSSHARRAGRPKTSAEIEELILRMVRNSPRWGYTRIRGALRILGHEIARNITDAEDGFLNGTRHLIRDRDPLFTDAFRELLMPAGVKTLRLPARSPAWDGSTAVSMTGW